MSKLSKSNLLTALQANDLDILVSMAKDDRTVVNRLIRLAYDKETLVGWRAILAMGYVARGFVAGDHEFLRTTCRKLLWSLNDESGGIGWAGPELLGEIVSADPRRFSDIVPLIVSVYEIDEDVFRAGVLYALGRIAEVAPECVAPYQEIMMRALADRDPLIRVRGIALIAKIWTWSNDRGIWGEEISQNIILTLERISADQGECWIYENSDFRSHQVGQDAITLLKTIY